MHGLRHWYASSLLAGGTSPVEVSAYLGHSDVAFTMRTYGHLMESSAERARTGDHGSLRQRSEGSERRREQRTRR